MHLPLCRKRLWRNHIVKQKLCKQHIDHFGTAFIAKFRVHPLKSFEGLLITNVKCLLLTFLQPRSFETATCQSSEIAMTKINCLEIYSINTSTQLRKMKIECSAIYLVIKNNNFVLVFFFTLLFCFMWKANTHGIHVQKIVRILFFIIVFFNKSDLITN